ncbi:polysaccharide deacetylase family protein [Ferrimonas kyonanensis]|uniref:polysaccharide deacetylase family protein n=1 Tax=Ferrimonas kyonanensis TaxID=364763 RepID=UPI0004863836|nr:polysaccharide deacetylase family protein [Ferrimonas kyonanensis]
MDKLVVFTSELDFCLCKTLVQLLEQYPKLQLLVLRQPATAVWASQWRRPTPHWSQCRWPLNSPSPLADTLNRYDPGRLRHHPRVQFKVVDDINSLRIRVLVEQYQADLGLSYGDLSLRPALHQLPHWGTLAIQLGAAFDEGRDALFWALWEQKPSVTIRVQRLEPDHRPASILLQTELALSAYSSERGLQIQLEECLIQMLCGAVGMISCEEMVRHSQEPLPRRKKVPSLQQRRQLQQQRRWVSLQSGLRTRMKSLFFQGYSHVWRPLWRGLAGFRGCQRVVVLAYHRVNDDLRDSLTVGIEQFEHQMAMVARHCTPVSLPSLMAGNIPKDAAKPLVAISFDDGYLDNHDNAVPVLERHGIPATFFVSTAMIGSNQPFQHDLDALGRGLPTMTWAQLTSMQQRGFTIGAHTQTHLNCAKASFSKVVAELQASKRQLEHHLGASDVLFAYPFGKASDINDAVMAQVKALGFRGCVSCHGGTNEGRIDPFDVKRMGVDANCSDVAFRAMIEGFCPPRLKARPEKRMSRLPNAATPPI